MDKVASDYYYDGVKASKQGHSLESNPYLFDAWPRKAWSAGWLFATAITAELAGEPTEELKRVDKSPEQQGYDAYINRVGMFDCPYSSQKHLFRQWQNGWLKAQGEVPEHFVYETEAFVDGKFINKPIGLTGWLLLLASLGIGIWGIIYLVYINA